MPSQLITNNLQLERVDNEKVFVLDELYQEYNDNIMIRESNEHLNKYFDSKFFDLTTKIKGQDKILKSIKTKLFSTLRSILKGKSERPRSLVFLGNSTTGKTEMARRIGEIFFGDYCLIPMSNFSAEHEKSMLVGTTSGYKGYDEPTIIEKYIATNSSKRYCFIFDELEKAPREIYSFLLNLLDTGTFVLLNGRVLDLKNSIVIFTGNIGIEKIRGSIGFNNEKLNPKLIGDAKSVNSEKVVASLKDYFSPEILNRIGRDNIYVFKDLNTSDKESIYKDYILEQLKKLEIKIGKRMEKYIEKKMQNLMADEKKTTISIREVKENIKDELIINSFFPKKKKIDLKQI